MEYSGQPHPQQHPQSTPKNWLVESILATLFCCMPFGIAGIVYALQVNSRVAAGDYQGALEASQNAGRWTKVSFWVGIAVVVLTLAFVFLFGGLALWQANRSNDF